MGEGQREGDAVVEKLEYDNELRYNIISIKFIRDLEF